MNKPRVDTGTSEFSLRADREDRLMLIGTDGHVAFMEEGRRELAPYFARAGIDLGTIKTRKQYLEARRAASPYFLEHLRSRLAGKPDTVEYNALRAIIDGDDTAFDRLFHQIKNQNAVANSFGLSRNLKDLAPFPRDEIHRDWSRNIVHALRRRWQRKCAPVRGSGAPETLRFLYKG